MGIEVKSIRDPFHSGKFEKRADFVLAGSLEYRSLGLEAKHLALKKPGFGIRPTRFNEILGCRLKRAVAADALLQDEDLELPQ